MRMFRLSEIALVVALSALCASSAFCCSAGYSLCDDRKVCCRSDTFCGRDSISYYGYRDSCYKKPKWHVLLYIIGDNDVSGFGYDEALQWYGLNTDHNLVTVDIFVDWDVSVLKEQINIDQSHLSHRCEHWWRDAINGEWKKTYFSNMKTVDMTSKWRLQWFLNRAYRRVPRATHRMLLLWDHAGPLSFGVDDNQCATRKVADNDGLTTRMESLSPGYYFRNASHKPHSLSERTRSCGRKSLLTARDISNVITSTKIRRFSIVGFIGCNWLTMTNALWMSQACDYMIGSETVTWLFTKNPDYDLSVFKDASKLRSYSVSYIANAIAKGTMNFAQKKKKRFNIVVLKQTSENVRRLQNAMRETVSRLTSQGNRGRNTASLAWRNAAKFPNINNYHPSMIDLGSWADSIWGTRNNVLRTAINKYVDSWWHTSFVEAWEISNLGEYYPAKHRTKWSTLKYIAKEGNPVWFEFMSWMHAKTPYTRPEYASFPQLKQSRDVLDGGFALSVEFSKGSGSVQHSTMFAGYKLSDGDFSIISSVPANISEGRMKLFWSADVYYASFPSAPKTHVEVFYTDSGNAVGNFEISIPFFVDLKTLVYATFLVEPKPAETPDEIISRGFLSMDLDTSKAAEFFPSIGSKWYPVYPEWKGPEMNPMEHLYYYEEHYLTFIENDYLILSGSDVSDERVIKERGDSAKAMPLEFVCTTFAGETISSQLLYDATTKTFSNGRIANKLSDDVPAPGIPKYTDLEEQSEDEIDPGQEEGATNNEDDGSDVDAEAPVLEIGTTDTNESISSPTPSENPPADCIATATLDRLLAGKQLGSLNELVLGFWHEDRDDVEVLCFYEDEHVCVTPMHLVRHKSLRDGQNVPAKELCAAGLLPCTRKRARVAAPVFRGAGGVEWMRDIGVTSSAHTWHARELIFGWRVTLDARYSHALHEAGRLLWYVPRDAVRRAFVTRAR